MKVLVTGATGFIGKELIKTLNANGHEILVLTKIQTPPNFVYLSIVKSSNGTPKNPLYHQAF
jgi:nucleoside-diphosphate-sugar epimerase